MRPATSGVSAVDVRPSFDSFVDRSTAGGSARLAPDLKEPTGDRCVLLRPIATKAFVRRTVVDQRRGGLSLASPRISMRIAAYHRRLVAVNATIRRRRFLPKSKKHASTKGRCPIVRHGPSPGTKAENVFSDGRWRREPG